MGGSVVCRSSKRVAFSVLFMVALCLKPAFATVYSVQEYQLEKRKFIAETVAIVVATEIEDKSNRKGNIEDILRNIVHGEDDVLSAAVRSFSDGLLIASVGNHSEHWALASQDRSNARQVQVPLFEGSQRIAIVEVRFTEPDLNIEIPEQYRYANILALCLSTDQLATKGRLSEILRFTLNRTDSIYPGVA